MPHPPRFYHPTLLPAPGEIPLPEEEARHAAGALRLRVGDPVELFDGRGTVAGGAVLALDRRSVRVAVETIRTEERGAPQLILGVAIPKGKRWQMLVEKCTELGVGEIQPLRFRWSVAEGEGNSARWERWAVEACKQSRRAWVPSISGPLTLDAFLERNLSGPCLVAQPGGETLSRWGGQFERAAAVGIVIGPEAGLTREEGERCAAAGYVPVSLGEHILRVETAAMAACALIRGLLQA